MTPNVRTATGKDRQAGIKCALRGIELFVREVDKDKALAVDRFMSQVIT